MVRWRPVREVRAAVRRDRAVRARPGGDEPARPGPRLRAGGQMDGRPHRQGRRWEPAATGAHRHHGAPRRGSGAGHHRRPVRRWQGGGRRLHRDRGRRPRRGAADGQDLARMPGGGDPPADHVSLSSRSSPEFDPASPHAELARVVRDHAARLAAALVRVTGDFATAEDLVQDAVMTALRRWPEEGVPARPDAWLFIVARNRGLDVLRRQANYRAKLAQLQWPVQPQPDERLRLIFTCCHPALARAAQIALTLRVVCGLTTAQIARAFLVPESTVAQRITRAKRKIADAGIPYRVPDADELGERLDEVLTVIYLVLNEGYLATARPDA